MKDKQREPREQNAVQLERGLSTAGALGLNIIDMVGVGPFVTLPLIVIAMGGPQAMLGWFIGAIAGAVIYMVMMRGAKRT